MKKMGVLLIFLVVSTTVVGFSLSSLFKSTVPKETSRELTKVKNFKAPVMEVTIYSNNMAFVKRRGTFDGNEGLTQISLLNFTQPVKDSLFIYDDKGKIRGWYIHNLRKIEEIKENYTLSFKEILNESWGKEIQVSILNNSFSGKLVWVWHGKIGIEQENGVLFLNLEDIGGLFIPGVDVSEKLRTENKTIIIPELVIKEISEEGLHNVLLAYLRSGANWNANYKFYMNSEEEEGRGTLQSWAFVKNNALEDWENVGMKLVVGYPNIVSYAPVYRYGNVYEGYLKGSMDVAASAPMIEEEVTPSSVGEYCTYTLDEKISINHSESKNLPIFSEEVEFKRKYLWKANLGNDIYKIYEINNTLDVPWAEGVFSVYLGSDFEGQDKIKYTPKESAVEVKVSQAPDIVVKKEILERTTEEGYGDVLPRKYARKTYYKVRLTIESHKDADATLIIKDEMQRGDEVNLISATIKPEVKLYSLKWDSLRLRTWEKRIIDYEYEVKTFYR